MDKQKAKYAFKYYGYSGCNNASNERCNIWIKSKGLILKDISGNKIAEYRSYEKINLFNYIYLSIFGELSWGYVGCEEIYKNISDAIDNKNKILKELNYEY
ncbi:hypothetical protein [Campylobacter geochelonis]|uniref:Uncharacterized protein n=1 Tax=Campylobacter geochelonis TaxID=1780362 RepID=A0A128EHT2_9BACT|nr:hypothetical protein [Campylobacter geochelonis]QKF71504.1 hypothetical protein CGEO_1206 [Campylobacter geochelonis]CZE48445.1 Uncharacterised protein [Campylobacter geochelonis]